MPVAFAKLFLKNLPHLYILRENKSGLPVIHDEVEQLGQPFQLARSFQVGPRGEGSLRSKPRVVANLLQPG
ncbi:hypothetical protein D1872_294150 [compost metagenome]